MAKFADLIERGEPIPMFGDGSTLRDYTYVGDIVDGIVRALDRCAGLNLYNLGNATPVPLAEMIATLGEALGKPVRINYLPEQPGDVKKTHADIGRARSDLGYDPRTTLQDGLERFVEWSRGQRLARS